ncbi:MULTISPECIES: hypothetical protein [unclassified Lentimonas]|uniref:hypothetical protein n=1 Tax=unclassified Lentimonas TaxID=2630993 RepID=UPI00132BDAD1|nr:MULTISPECIES: hypothetical protein [unclassified Lentimonas]CAA6679953.1 Unannotated [Lentimonas sp. CC4]CAA6686509.1 Unannotated [Lentimonas sp. CC6]CAA7074785.1 Unannotated [Lentimonas sp. CC4]CAA7169411.1 Unannotated [Lentimonas sp. CC21]CAA7180197.1 Unannotated [Lentimonas sp. CC8]
MQEFEITRFFEQFADAPRELAHLEAHFKGHNALLCALLDEADDSGFSLHQWVEALVVLSQWLDARGLTVSTEESLGYVSCAAASADSGGTLSHLPSLVSDFLEQYGCERSVEK